MYLFIDTTKNDQSTVGLMDCDGRFAARHEWAGGQNQSEKLIAKIEELLAGQKITKNDLRKIVVVTGPGSYTGQRVGVATANALAYGLDLPIAGITNDEIESGRLSNIVNAGQKNPVSASYLNPPHITKPKNHRH